MIRASFPLCRLMGVDVRLHWSFPLLFCAALAFGQYTTGSPARGLGVFAALLLAVLIRETARALAAVYTGLDLRILFLLPIGGVMGFAPEPSGRSPQSRALVFAAPIANALAGIIILLLSYAAAPGVDLLRQPWISAAHVLRTFVWMQFILAAINLLPAATLPSRQLLRAGGATTDAAPAASPVRAAAAFSLVAGLAVSILLAGMLTANLWFVLMGAFLLLYSQLRSHSASAAGASQAGDSLLVEEVMSSDYIALSSSDTLRGALDRIVSTAQDVFPVVRGDRMVGAISRQTLQGHLQASGDSYVQGVMTRTLETARREEPLTDALSRAAGTGYSECVAVVDGFEGRAGGRVLGLLTPQTVQAAVQQLKMTRERAETRKPRA